MGLGQWARQPWAIGKNIKNCAERSSLIAMYVLCTYSGTGVVAGPGQQVMNPPPTMTYGTAGPHHIEVQEFDGFGPMGTAQLGDW